MGWSKYALLTLILVMVFTLAAFGSHFGYEVNGIPKGGEIGVEPLFLWDLATLSIDGLDPLFGMAFDIIIILVGFIALSWVRGNN